VNDVVRDELVLQHALTTFTTVNPGGTIAISGTVVTGTGTTFTTVLNARAYIKVGAAYYRVRRVISDTVAWIELGTGATVSAGTTFTIVRTTVTVAASQPYGFTISADTIDATIPSRIPVGNVTAAVNDARPNINSNSGVVGGLTRYQRPLPKGGLLEVSNTNDTTNFEAGRMGFMPDTGGILEIGTYKGGSGTSRNLRIGISPSAGYERLQRYMEVSGVNTPFFSYQWGNTSALGTMFDLGSGNSLIAGSGVTTPGAQVLQALNATIGQGGTSSYTVSLINVIETTTGSGSKLLCDWKVGPNSGALASKFSVDNAGNLAVAGAVTAGGVALVGTTSTQTLTNKTLTAPVINGFTEGVTATGTVTTAATLSISAGTVLTATLTASTACTFTMPAVGAGKSFTLLLKQAASTGNGTATFTGVKWGSLGAPTITATAGAMDILTFVSDGTNWYGAVTQGFTP
jgi:hypothetical protein